MNFDEYKLKCYLLARYQEEYRAAGTFNQETTKLIEEGMLFEKEGGIPFLEAMISHGDLYNEMDRKHCPILIYVGDPICYGVLDRFARSLGYALDELGCLVEFFDPNGNKLSGISRFTGKRFKAVIGIQTFAFSVEMKDGTNLHDLLEGPKFNMLLDHPVWLKRHLENGPKDYSILTHDSNYLSFIKEYFPEVKHSFLLPPAGTLCPEELPKDLPLTFVGTYHNWREWKGQLRTVNRETKGIVRAFLQYMRKHTDLTWEEGLRQTLALPRFSSHRQASLAREDKKAFVELMFQIKPVCFVVMSYLREKILDVIAEAGLPLHVYGDSFRRGRYANVKTFIRHAEVTPEESLAIYARSRISLNIMSWHKAGMTERIANMMLNRAVVVTDDSDYLKEQYCTGEDYVRISLREISRIPEILREILEDDSRCERIAENAFQKAVQKEVWKQRAEALLNIIHGSASSDDVVI